MYGHDALSHGVVGMWAPGSQDARGRDGEQGWEARGGGGQAMRCQLWDEPSIGGMEVEVEEVEVLSPEDDLECRIASY
ncbi:hypothetical protein DRW03_23070 [Corallococcus sp. H22C18031201]|nr:hypothetical protein DRW03_23070 [Corallococcus sp. H22C18031201]